VDLRARVLTGEAETTCVDRIGIAVWAGDVGDCGPQSTAVSILSVAESELVNLGAISDSASLEGLAVSTGKSSVDFKTTDVGVSDSVASLAGFVLSNRVASVAFETGDVGLASDSPTSREGLAVLTGESSVEVKNADIDVARDSLTPFVGFTVSTGVDSSFENTDMGAA
jgi:hypothetical protein